MKIRDIVTQLRATGLTQAQIAQKSGLTQPTISRLLNGVARDTSYSTAQKLQALLKQHDNGQVQVPANE